MKHIDNVYLRELCKKANIPSVSSKTVKYKILPEIIRKVKTSLNDKLNKATNIVLIVDLWSNKQMTGFCGLAAMVTYENFEKECFVIGLKRVHGRHDAENLKSLIESIVDEYGFDKAKLMEVVGDNGSNICRLFELFEQDQSSNFNFVSDSEIESDSGEDYEEEDEKELEEESYSNFP